MIGLDTNVVIRYLVQDDPDQSATASALIDELTEAERLTSALSLLSKYIGSCAVPTGSPAAAALNC